MQDPVNPESEPVLSEREPVVAEEETVVPTTPEAEKDVEKKAEEAVPPTELTREEIEKQAQDALNAEILAAQADAERIAAIEKTVAENLGVEPTVDNGPSAGGDQSFEATNDDFQAAIAEGRGALAAAHAEGQGSDGNVAVIPAAMETAVVHTDETASARPIASLEGDESAPDTPQEISETFQEAVVVQEQALSLSVSLERSGLVGIIPSKTELLSYLPKDSPLLLPSNERSNLSPEQAVRAEVDAYGLMLTAMASLDLQNFSTPDDPAKAAAQLDTLADMFDGADRLRQDIPNGAREALNTAMRDAATRAVSAPSRLSSDAEVGIWVNEMHTNLPNTIRNIAKSLREGTKPELLQAA